MSTLIESLMAHPNATQAADALDALTLLDDAFLQKARLGIMSTLLALGEADFKLLKEALSLSDGNLSTHLAVLEERGYVHIHKEFVRRKPHTTYSPTNEGRDAFLRYLQALERIIRAADTVSSARDTGEEAPPDLDLSVVGGPPTGMKKLNLKKEPQT
jgi:DNA-binding transcriptional ArsR family regulator